ncbi:apolipoprotein A-II [Gopherus flavomarginatus]|uniref:Apolipoprotein A-II n=2 Tax=Gopherus TaxID=38771 RepID=A0A452GZA6_9SAUR|nr:apolipoprotein A-II [Gopherus evgoodei]XP_030398014.1 apolipoprotein A-II [Gopherus evgoodei]XP_030398015.1 apolipoprotein A-II [Gopherus evgoodei]XP_030398016.1 apolipoprotein A-II [Gopherus evgoodei]XP_050785959.1 apolipoprotein A-II [Gopherus flavomarginatus]XP_050785961.1 apolipoprotein A-II [Gopherus flavomarginatus]XP_050785962.1 apolipoprotein A-II [Gopherus flavomarginatus]XP_050785963.1 apolipoprotein A-II [Gopherus flavomarginatus]
MKVLVLAVVLLCVCSLEGAVVKRNAETPSLSDVFTQYFQTVSEYLSKHLPEKAKTEELKTQARAYLEQANEQLSPIAKRLHTELVELITQLVETGKKAVQK